MIMIDVIMVITITLIMFFNIVHLRKVRTSDPSEESTIERVVA